MTAGGKSQIILSNEIEQPEVKAKLGDVTTMTSQPLAWVTAGGKNQAIVLNDTAKDDDTRSKRGGGIILDEGWVANI